MPLSHQQRQLIHSVVVSALQNLVPTRFSRGVRLCASPLCSVKLLSVALAFPAPFCLTCCCFCCSSCLAWPPFQLSIASLSFSLKPWPNDTSFIAPYFTDTPPRSHCSLFSAACLYFFEDMNHVSGLAYSYLCQSCFPWEPGAQWLRSQTS